VIVSAQRPNKPPLNGMDRSELAALCRAAGVKESHAGRLNAALYRHGIEELAQIEGLPDQFRHWLGEHTVMLAPQIVAEQLAEDGTRKFLLRLADGKQIESVLIPGAGRLTQCISTQVGCAVGCGFCLTASGGLVRNLTAAEMVAELFAGKRLAGEMARNLVLMGMGEPLHNYEEVAKFVRLATDPQGFAFAPRRVTLSTAGMVPAMRRMLEERLPCNLAVSLNATLDVVRDAIMPINRKYPIAEVMAVLRDYAAVYGRKRVLIEYVLLAGINDTPADAQRLLGLLEGLPATVNLLPFNPHPGSPYRRPADADVTAFRAVLVAAGRVAVVRESRGDEISAACGQLLTESRQQRHTATNRKDSAGSH